MTQSRFQRYLLILSLILMTISLYSLLWQTQRQPCCKRGSLTAADVLPQKYMDDLPVCSAIIKGDATDMGKDNLQLLMTSKNKKNLLTEAFYLNMTLDCKTYVKERGFLTVPLTEEERDFPIAYSIVIHEKIEMFERLLRAIYTPQNVYCVHVDLKSSEEYKKAVKGITSCFPNVFVASKLENVVYASWSRVQADLNCMKDLLNSNVQWRYLLNTCGADFPIKTNAEMVQALQVLNGKNSMESEVTNSNKKGRWQFQHRVNTTVIRTAVQKSPPPINSPMFSGNAYFVVTRDFVRNVMESKQVQHFLEWEKDTYSPDEHLWATLQRMPSVPGSNPADEKYHASDMQAIARVVKWSYLAGDVNKGAPYTPCTGTYRRAVCVYGFGDLQWLLQQHHLIANKFDPEVDDVAIRCLEAVLRYKAVHHKYSVTENSIHALRI